MDRGAGIGLARSRDFDPGEILFLAGEEAAGLFVIVLDRHRLRSLRLLAGRQDEPDFCSPTRTGEPDIGGTYQQAGAHSTRQGAGV
jgi:hypothetical protein